MKTYAIVLFLLGACSHANPAIQNHSQGDAQQLSNTQGVSHGQDHYNDNNESSMSNTQDCLPNSDIESNPKKQKSFALVRTRCKSEIEKLCQGIECPQLMKPTQVCLMMNDGDISKECKREINRHIKEYQPSVKALDE